MNQKSKISRNKHCNLELKDLHTDKYKHQQRKLNRLKKIERYPMLFD